MLRPILLLVLNLLWPGTGASNNPVKFTDISGYKYRLDDEIVVQTDLRTSAVVRLLGAELDMGGLITLSPGFMWDGASGPTLDTPNWIRASAVHDFIYRILKAGVLDDVDFYHDRGSAKRWDLDHEGLRKFGDDLMHDMLIEDGMTEFRANYSWAAVRLSPWAAWRALPWPWFNKWM